MHSQIAEEEATDDLDRVEFRDKLALGEQVEQFIVSGNEPLLSDCSIVMARYSTPGSTANYRDNLYRQFGIEMKPLEMRQVSALRETLPCGVEREPVPSKHLRVHARPCRRASVLQPRRFQRCVLRPRRPGLHPMFLDPLAAPAANKPPAMLIAGEPGSGKTFTAQAIALQSALAGHKTVFINPKSDDTLEGLTDLVEGEVVLSEISEQGVLRSVPLLPVR